MVGIISLKGGIGDDVRLGTGGGGELLKELGVVKTDGKTTARCG